METTPGGRLSHPAAPALGALPYIAPYIASYIAPYIEP